MSTMEDTKGTIILAFILDDAIIVGYDSRGTEGGIGKNIVRDNFEKLFETKGVYVAIAGRAASGKLVFKNIQIWAKGQHMQKVKVSEVAKVAEDFVMGCEWPEANQFAMLIMGMEDGRPLVFSQKNFDPTNLKAATPIGSHACKTEKIKNKIGLGSSSRYFIEEMEKYKCNMTKDEGCDLAASIMLKASLFDSMTGGSVHVDYINHNGRTSTKWIVPGLYLERFRECVDWDRNTLFMIFINQECAFKNELVKQWITTFSFIGEGGVLSSHIIGGYHGDLQRKAILRRVVFKEKKMIDDLFESAVWNNAAKEYHIEWEGCKVHLRKPSATVLRYLLCLEKKRTSMWGI